MHDRLSRSASRDAVQMNKPRVGDEVGPLILGFEEGVLVGLEDGSSEGRASTDGLEVGPPVGVTVGCVEIGYVGYADGWYEGSLVGLAVGGSLNMVAI